MRAFATIAIIAFAGIVSAQEPTSAAVDLVEAQFEGALIKPGVIAEFDPKGIVTAEFSSPAGKITNGQVVSQQDSSTRPAISFAAPAAAYSAADSPLSKPTTNFTMMMVDGDYPGADITQGLNAHWISNDWGYGAVSNGVLSFTAPTTAPIIEYAGPGPAPGSGPHRYIILIFPQPQGYLAPAVPAAGGSVTRIRYNEYTDGLTAPIGAVYFVVENGAATVQVSATKAVTGVATPAGSTPAATGAATTKPTAAGTGTGSAASSTSTASSNSASKHGAHLTGGAVAGFAVFVAAALFA